MKKLSCMISAIIIAVSLTACGSKTDEKSAAGFAPHLDTNTSCSITVAGSYDNFDWKRNLTGSTKYIRMYGSAM